MDNQEDGRSHQPMTAPVIISTPMGDAKDPVRAPITVGGYKMIRLLGRGSTGSVYLAEQISMERLVALKILSPSLAEDTTFVARFLREARAAARLNHPNIVSAIDVGEMDSVHYMAMEYVDGESLASLLQREPVLPSDRVLAIASQVVDALEHASIHKVVHRDIKPANIMICKDGRVKVADLGLATYSGSPFQTTYRQAVGTPYYMSPEQVEGRLVDWRSDQYSIGASLYEASTGLRPFDGDTLASILTRRLMEDPVPAHRANLLVDPNLSLLLSKMMARRPENRYQTIDDLRQDIKLVSEGKKPAYASESMPRMAKKRPPTSLAGHQGPRMRARSAAVSQRWWLMVLYLSSAALTAMLVWLLFDFIETGDNLSDDPNTPGMALWSKEIDAGRQNSVQARLAWKEAWATALSKDPDVADNLVKAANALHALAENPEFYGSAYARSAPSSEEMLRNMAKVAREQAGDIRAH